MRRIIQEKGRLILGWCVPVGGSFLFLYLFAICLQIVHLDVLGWMFVSFRTKLDPSSTHVQQVGMLIAAIWVFLLFYLLHLGFEIGLRIIKRFYTREEMFEIIAGPLRSKPLSSRRIKYISRKLNRLYPEQPIER